MERVDGRWLGRGQLAALATFVLAVSAEVCFYPQLATWLYLRLSGRTGWDGSGLDYVRAVFVVPVGVALTGGSVVFAFLLARRRPSAVMPLILLSWFLNGFLLALSISWYSGIADKG